MARDLDLAKHPIELSVAEDFGLLADHDPGLFVIRKYVPQCKYYHASVTACCTRWRRVALHRGYPDDARRGYLTMRGRYWMGVEI
jgi:hypothetical protein